MARQLLKSATLMVVAALFLVTTLPAAAASTSTLATRLRGRILLQVESHGEAWYVNPVNSKRYYLGTPEDAVQVMRQLGLGVSNKDFERFQGKAPARLAGRIILKVEDVGQAYYIHPQNLTLHYLSPADALTLMRTFGLGISNRDLENVPIVGNEPVKIPTLPGVNSSLKPLVTREIVKRIKPAVVFIETASVTGSGMIVEAGGLILTNAHVVTGVSTATVKLSDGRRLPASVVGRDENVDLALLKVEVSNLPTVIFGDSSLSALRQGDPVFAFGFPRGLSDEVTLTTGILSARQTINGSILLQISVAIHPGNSGGPLVNQYGEVIGVNTFALGAQIDGQLVGESVKFALPIETALVTLPDLKAGRNVVLNKQPVPTPPTKEEAQRQFATALSDIQTLLDATTAARDYFKFTRNAFDYLDSDPIFVASNIKWRIIIDEQYLKPLDGIEPLLIGQRDFIRNRQNQGFTLNEKEIQDLASFLQQYKEALSKLVVSARQLYQLSSDAIKQYLMSRTSTSITPPVVPSYQEPPAPRMTRSECYRLRGSEGYSSACESLPE